MRWKALSLPFSTWYTHVQELCFDAMAGSNLRLCGVVLTIRADALEGDTVMFKIEGFFASSTNVNIDSVAVYRQAEFPYIAAKAVKIWGDGAYIHVSDMDEKEHKFLLQSILTGGRSISNSLGAIAPEVNDWGQSAPEPGLYILENGAVRLCSQEEEATYYEVA